MCSIFFARKVCCKVVANKLNCPQTIGLTFRRKHVHVLWSSRLPFRNWFTPWNQDSPVGGFGRKWICFSSTTITLPVHSGPRRQLAFAFTSRMEHDHWTQRDVFSLLPFISFSTVHISFRSVIAFRWIMLILSLPATCTFSYFEYNNVVLLTWL